MYYSNQDYMQDLNFYNQNPNMQNMGNMGQYPYQGMPNNNCMYNQFQNSFMGNNMQAVPLNQTMQINNSLEGMYPCIYRIINPVVERVLNGIYTRNQMITEDNLNNMVDTVFNIVEGQIEKEDSSNTTNNISSTSSDSRNNNVNSNNQNRNSNNVQERNDNIIANQRDRNNSLIKDIIRILIIRSLISRNLRNNNFSNMQNNPQMMRQMQNFF